MKKPSFTKNLLGFAFLLFLVPHQSFSQTLFGTNSVPTDNNSQTAPTPPVITPPASMLAGDLVVIFGEYHGTGATAALSMNQAGGQTWATIAGNSGSTQTTSVFWCTFSGNWSASPSIKSAAGTAGMTAVMYVYRPSSTNCTWRVQNAIANSSTGTSPYSITGITTTAPHTVTMAFWSTAFANTWGTLNGTGWDETGLSAQIRNKAAASNQSMSAAYFIQTGQGATGNVTQLEGGTATTAVTSILSWAQSPDNDNCANAILLTSGTSSSLVGATGDGGSITSTCTAVASPDVWYKFVAQNTAPTITVNNLGGSWGTGLKIQVLSGTCGSFTEVACVNNANTITPTLTLGTTYYIRIHKNTAGAPTGSYANWSFDLFIDPAPKSRMNEVWSRSVLSSGALNTPWEVTYGPDGFLWVTASQDYKAYRIDPTSGASTQILDLSTTSTDFPAIKAQFDYATVSPKPQGGFAGLAIHPEFNSGKPYVYISYVRKKDSTSIFNAGCGFFKNSLVRFTYNSGTGKLESPVVLCDTLPGGNDHNSQRIICAPVGNTYYLFYGQGEMGAGQLACQLRPNYAQDTTHYEGKILRFNLESDLDASSAFDQWIPNDNPYNHGGVQSAVWDLGIRNNQGFAYNPTTKMLYASMHGPYSDDEINIVERYKNYGHPLVEGYSWDGNYNGTTTQGLSTSYSAGETFATGSGISTLAPIGDEAANVAAINASGHAPYKEPLFSGYPSGGPGYPTASKTVAAIWSASPKPGNGAWPSEAWSGIDVYTHTIIPGWKNSLLVCGLKWGRVLRLKLNVAGDSVIKTDGADTIAYFQAKNRYRDLAIDPNGKTLYVSNEGTSAVGPGGISPVPTVSTCTNCIIKYTFLGYSDNAGTSTLPDAIPVSDSSLSQTIPVNAVDSGTQITIDNTNNQLWVPITGPDGNILAEIYPNGNNLGVVKTAFYKHAGAIRVKAGIHYLDRNITITPTTQPSTPVKIRLYLTNMEFDSLDHDNLSGISSIADLNIITNEDPCSAAIATSTTPVTTSLHLSRGAGEGYVLQGTVSQFSSFFFANGNVALPLNLLSFKGSLQSNNTVLQWETTDEINTSNFIIERSIDGQSFQEIGTTPATGNNNGSKYTFTDYEASQQSSLVLYYRLKMVDKDGAFVYSGIVTITLPATTRISVSPNPTSHQVTVAIATSTDAKVKWTLTDNAGHTIRQNFVQIKKGSNTFSINMSSFSSGFYYLSVSGGGIDNKIKIEKL